MLKLYIIVSFVCVESESLADYMVRESLCDNMKQIKVRMTVILLLMRTMMMMIIIIIQW